MMNFSVGSIIDHLGDAMMSEGDASSTSFPSHPNRRISTVEDSFGKYEKPHRPSHTSSASQSPFLTVSASATNNVHTNAEDRLSLSTWEFDKEGLDARANVAEVPRSFFPALATAQYIPLSPVAPAHRSDNSTSYSASPNRHNTAGSGDQYPWQLTTIEGVPITQSSTLNGTSNPTPGHYYSNSMHTTSISPSSFVSNSLGAGAYGASSPTSSAGEVLPHVGSVEHFGQRNMNFGVVSQLAATSSGSPPHPGRPVPRIQLLASRHKRRAKSSNNTSAYSLRTSSSTSYSQGRVGGGSVLGGSIVSGGEDAAPK